MIKACIFDLDGTLADTLESMAIAANDALGAVGYQALPVENYKYYAGDGAKTLVERALFDAARLRFPEGADHLAAPADVTAGADAFAAAPSASAPAPGLAAADSPALAAARRDFEQVYELYSARFKEDCTYKVRIFDGIMEMLKGLKARKIKTAVLSNKPHERVLDVIGKLFGEGVFDAVQGQQDQIPKKPDPAGALMIAETLGVLPQECMYFGDTNVDMQTGNAAGMDTVGVLWGFRTRQELEENQAHHILAHPRQILALMDRKNEGIVVTTPVRLIVSDVDGTLVKNGQKYLEDGFIDTVNALMDQGITFAVASGRQRQSIQDLFAGTARPLYMICENGGNLHYDGKDLDFHAFSREMYQEIFRSVRAYRPDAFFAMAAPDYYYTENTHPEFANTLANKYFFRVRQVEDLEHLPLPVCKIAVYIEDNIQAVGLHFQKMWGDRMEIAVSGDYWVDFTPKGIGKGSGVTKLQELLGVRPEETMVFGDNENDVSMMRCAAYSCAVSSALPAAKRAARYETDNVLSELKKLLK